MFSLNGKTALITGSGRGIGLAIASGQRILQVRVAHRCGDGVVVGVAVAHDEDFGRHECPFLPTYGFDAV